MSGSGSACWRNLNALHPAPELLLTVSEKPVDMTVDLLGHLGAVLKRVLAHTRLGSLALRLSEV